MYLKSIKLIFNLGKRWFLRHFLSCADKSTKIYHLLEFAITFMKVNVIIHIIRSIFVTLLLRLIDYSAYIPKLPSSYLRNMLAYWKIKFSILMQSLFKSHNIYLSSKDLHLLSKAKMRAQQD